MKKEMRIFRQVVAVGAFLGALATWQVFQSPPVLHNSHFTIMFIWHVSALMAVSGVAVVLDRYLFRHWFGCSFLKIAGMRTGIHLLSAAGLALATVNWYGTLVPLANKEALYWNTFLFYGFSFFGATIFLEFSKLAGSRFLDKLILGRYHRPRKEQRIFLFIDLKESTRLSKELPLETYSLLLKEFFRDIDGAMERYDGEIYQYAGDQVIVSWEARTANYQNAVRAFLSFFNGMRSKRPYYIERYGVVPRYKAAMHSGEVVGTWVGRLKRELVFQGEVLNIAARITGLAKNLSYPVLLTKPVVEQLNEELREMIIEGGAYALKGVEEAISLYFLQVNQTNSPPPANPPWEQNISRRASEQRRFQEVSE